MRKRAQVEYVVAIGVAVVVAMLALYVPSARGSSGFTSTMLMPWLHSGFGVNETTGGRVCPLVWDQQCQAAVQSKASGGFYPVSVTADWRTGDVYVADIVNHRVQELTATGEFVSMFGWDVNQTEDERPTASQEQRNVCTAASKDVCTAGVSGARPGQLSSPASVAVDSSSGEVYVLDVEPGDIRVDKFTGEGRFLWRLGKAVNLTRRRNLCTAVEAERDRVRCGPGEPAASGSTQPGALDASTQSGDLLAVGGPQHLLYVGDEHRVQVFGTDGRPKREILLASLSAQPHSSVVALALAASGELYVVYRAGAIETDLPSERTDVVHELNRAGEQVAEFVVAAGQPDGFDSVDGLALDPYGHLAVIGAELGTDGDGRFGRLYSAPSGEPLGEFAPPPDHEGIAFNGHGDLYVATAVDYEVAIYAPQRPFSLNPLAGILAIVSSLVMAS